MSKKSFSASDWFVNKKANLNISPENIIRDRSQELKARKSLLPSFCGHEDKIQLENELNRFFVPGWKGESLISKDVKEFVKIIDHFHGDVKKHFLSVDKFSRRQKVAIFEEFMSFAEYKTLQCSNLDNSTTFWKEIKSGESEYQEQIDRFIDIFSFRIAVIYLFKVRFITTLLEQTHGDFDIKNILYPNSFLTSVFRSASSRELKAKSFEQNIFSWYRPSADMQESLLSFKEISTKLLITEIIKTISVKAEEILGGQTEYSHSLSHKQFGLFINSLLINFPLWLSTLGKQNYNPYVTKDNMEIISCKFAGDYLESLGLSHWLAQKHNKYLKWDQILCPDFKSQDFEKGLYLKNLSELQFLTFLAEIGNGQDRDPIDFICKVVNSHLYNRKNSGEIQKSLMLDDNEGLNSSTYDRIILNLVKFPKNNPNHFLFSKIMEQKPYLKKNGFIYVLSSKRLFVPSQKQKVEALLKQIKIEGVFDLSSVEGKGEVGSFLYIFSNRDETSFTINQSQKHNCINFRYQVDLNTFHEFEKLTKLTQTFFEKNLGDLPPLSQIFDGSSRLEFYQDAIVGGQLIHSTNKDISKITHPSFFRKLMSLCNPLDFFFDLKPINFNQNNSSSYDNLFDYGNEFSPEISNHVIIVDQRSKTEVKVEIISANLLEAKAYEYGHASCSYFYAIKKWPQLNLFAIKDFLDSSIGKQIINLTFNNEVRKVKGNLNKLLIPKFYINDGVIPEHIKQGLRFLELDSEKLLNMHPTSIEQAFSNIESFIPAIINDYPAQVLNLFTIFKRTVQKSVEQLGNNEGGAQGVNFNNPLLKSPLLLSKTSALYPDNQEVYVDFSGDAGALIHSALTKTKLVQLKQYEETTYGLEVFHEDQKVLTLHTDEDMTYFLDFLLSNTKGMPISKILQGISIPSIEDLKSIIGAYKSLKKALETIQKRLNPLQSQLLSSTIFQSK